MRAGGGSAGCDEFLLRVVASPWLPLQLVSIAFPPSQAAGVLPLAVRKGAADLVSARDGHALVELRAQDGASDDFSDAVADVRRDDRGVDRDEVDTGGRRSCTVKPVRARTTASGGIRSWMPPSFCARMTGSGAGAQCAVRRAAAKRAGAILFALAWSGWTRGAAPTSARKLRAARGAGRAGCRWPADGWY